MIQMSYYISPHLLNPINWLQGNYLEFLSLLFDLPAEQLHEVLEAILAEEIKGALGWAQVDEQEYKQDNSQKGYQQVPAGCQDVVPLGLVWTLLGKLQVALSLLVPGLHRCIQTCSHWGQYEESPRAHRS